eukprot:s288_g8.t1
MGCQHSHKFGSAWVLLVLQWLGDLAEPEQSHKHEGDDTGKQTSLENAGFRQTHNRRKDGYGAWVASFQRLSR